MRAELEKFNTEFHQYVLVEFDEKYKKSQSVKSSNLWSTYDPSKKGTTDNIGYDENTREWVCKLCHIGRKGIFV